MISNNIGDLVKNAMNNSADKVGNDESAPKDTLEKRPSIDSKGRAYGTGRRKNSAARVWIKPGNGTITVNGRKYEDYFGRLHYREYIKSIFAKLNCIDQFDIFCTVRGGGLTGQSGAILHGIARALDNYNPVLWHTMLSRSKLLTRDDRMVESKKYGRHKARRSIQFAKR